MSILSKGICRTAASQINAVCVADAKNREDGKPGLSATATESVRDIAEGALTTQSRRHQQKDPRVQQAEIERSRIKINYHLAGDGLLAAKIVDQVALGKQGQAAYTQAYYQQQIDVLAPADPVSAANARVLADKASVSQPPPVPAAMQEGPMFPPPVSAPPSEVEELN